MRLIDADTMIENIKEYSMIDGTVLSKAEKRVIDCICNHIDLLEPTIEAVPLIEIYRVIAGHSDYHGDNILATMTCIAEGKDVKPTGPLEAVPVVHGEWVWKDLNYDGSYILVCSECLESEGARERANFCPNCGAKMDGES